MVNIKISLGMSHVFTKYGLDEIAVYKLWHDIGYRYISYDYGFWDAQMRAAMSNKWADAAKMTRDKLSDIGLTPVTAHIARMNPFSSVENEAAIARLICFTGVMGIDSIVIPLGAYANNTRGEFEAANVAYIARLLRVAEEYDVALLIEHSGGFIYPNYAHHAMELNRLIDMSGAHRLLKVNLNMGNMGLADISPYSEIRLIGDAIRSVDLSDNFGAMALAVKPERADLALAPMMGYLDFDELFRGLSDIGYNAHINLKLDMPREFDRAPREGIECRLIRMPLELTARLYKWVLSVAKHMLSAYDALDM